MKDVLGLGVFLLALHSIESENTQQSLYIREQTKETCASRCYRLHDRSLARTGLSRKPLTQLLEKQTPPGMLRDSCWRLYDLFDCMRHCDTEPKDFNRFEAYAVARCHNALIDLEEHLKCISRYHSFMEVRCSSFLREASNLRANLDSQYAPDQETCRYLHLNALCLENAVLSHCPNAEHVFTRLNFRDYFLNFIVPANDSLFDDADLNYCQLYNFVDVSAVQPTKQPYNKFPRYSPRGSTTTPLPMRTSTLIEVELEKLRRKNQRLELTTTSTTTHIPTTNSDSADAKTDTVEEQSTSLRSSEEIEVEVTTQNAQHYTTSRMSRSTTQLSGRTKYTTRDLLSYRTPPRSKGRTRPKPTEKPRNDEKTVEAVAEIMKSQKEKQEEKDKEKEEEKKKKEDEKKEQKEEAITTTKPALKNETLGAEVIITEIYEKPTLKTTLVVVAPFGTTLKPIELETEADVIIPTKKPIMNTTNSRKPTTRQVDWTAAETGETTTKPEDKTTEISINEEDDFDVDFLLEQLDTVTEISTTVSAPESEEPFTSPLDIELPNDSTTDSITASSTTDFYEPEEHTLTHILPTDITLEPTSSMPKKEWSTTDQSTSTDSTWTTESAPESTTLVVVDAEPTITASKDLEISTETLLEGVTDQPVAKTTHKKLFSSDEDFEITPPNFFYSTYRIGLIPKEQQAQWWYFSTLPSPTLESESSTVANSGYSDGTTVVKLEPWTTTPLKLTTARSYGARKTTMYTKRPTSDSPLFGSKRIFIKKIKPMQSKSTEENLPHTTSKVSIIYNENRMNEIDPELPEYEYLDENTSPGILVDAHGEMTTVSKSIEDGEGTILLGAAVHRSEIQTRSRDESPAAHRIIAQDNSEKPTISPGLTTQPIDSSATRTLILVYGILIVSTLLVIMLVLVCCLIRKMRQSRSPERKIDRPSPP